VRFGREGTSTGFEGEGTRASEVATNFSWNRERERGYSLERRRAPRHALSVKLRGFDAADAADSGNLVAREFWAPAASLSARAIFKVVALCDARMMAAEAPPAGGGVASTLEKDLKELERLLKADASGGGSDAAEGNAALAAGSSVKQQLREVLRKLMEAYFVPAAVHKRETRSLLGLMKVALQRHAEVFTGSSTFCARAFAHLLPLVTCASLRCDLGPSKRSGHPPVSREKLCRARLIRQRLFV
jgi:hypothetical protein